MTAGATGPGGLSGRDVVFRLDRGFRKPLVARGSTALVLAVLAVLLASAGIAVDVALGLAAAFAVVALGYAARYLWTGRFRTRLTTEGIEIRGYFDHFVPWRDVAGLDVAGSSLPQRARLRAEPYLAESGAVTTGYDTVRPGAGQLQWQWQMVSQADSTSGYRAKLATVRVARARGHPLLLRAPLVTAWQSDPQFGAKVRTIHQWWQACGPGPAHGHGPGSAAP
jgi:hypothetical protein